MVALRLEQPRGAAAALAAVVHIQAERAELPAHLDRVLLAASVHLQAAMAVVVAVQGLLAGLRMQLVFHVGEATGKPLQLQERQYHARVAAVVVALIGKARAQVVVVTGRILPMRKLEPQTLAEAVVAGAAALERIAAQAAQVWSLFPCQLKSTLV